MVGQNLKQARLTSGMTLSNLADATGFSIAYLSNVERDATSPTLDNLNKICNALNVSVVNILKDEPSSNFLVKKENRKQVFGKDSNIKYELLTEGAHSLRGISIVISIDCKDEVVSPGHIEEEFGILIEGKMQVTIENDIFTLEPGDTIFIESQKHHKLQNIGDCDCISYWALYSNEGNNHIH